MMRLQLDFVKNACVGFVFFFSHSSHGLTGDGEEVVESYGEERERER